MDDSAPAFTTKFSVARRDENHICFKTVDCVVVEPRPPPARSGEAIRTQKKGGAHDAADAESVDSRDNSCSGRQLVATKVGREDSWWGPQLVWKIVCGDDSWSGKVGREDSWWRQQLIGKKVGGDNN